MKNLILWLLSPRRANLIESEYLNLVVGTCDDIQVRAYASIKVLEVWKTGFDLSRRVFCIGLRLDVSIQIACFCADFNLSTKSFYL